MGLALHIICDNYATHKHPANDILAKVTRARKVLDATHCADAPK
jgi:hypothetical protein